MGEVRILPGQRHLNGEIAGGRGRLAKCRFGFVCYQLQGAEINKQPSTGVGGQAALILCQDPFEK